MLKKIRKWIKKREEYLEKKLRSILESMKDKVIAKAMARFQKNHPHIPVDTLQENLLFEFERITAFSYQSILKYNIWRSNWVFLAAAIAGTLVVFLTKGAGLLFIAPNAGAIVGWIASLATIPRACKTRLKGGMDSEITRFIRDFNQKNSTTEICESLGINRSLQISENLEPISQPANIEEDEVREVHFHDESGSILTLKMASG